MGRRGPTITQAEFDAMKKRGIECTVSGTAAEKLVAKEKEKLKAVQAGMNKLETQWSLELEDKRKSGEIRWWVYMDRGQASSTGFRLAQGTHYYPDFLVQEASGLVCIHETKGYWRDDARLKAKVIAQNFPFFGFLAVQGKPCNWTFETLANDGLYNVRITDPKTTALFDHLEALYRVNQISAYKALPFTVPALKFKPDAISYTVVGHQYVLWLRSKRTEFAPAWLTTVREAHPWAEVRIF